MKIELDEIGATDTRQIIFQPGDGTRYDIVLIDDPYGGVLVIWPGDSTWRWYKNDYLKFLHGKNNEYTRRAIWNYLEGIQA
jgi:signal peptidase I